ncbi:LysR family transcriptional regulator substrate-binding protein [Frankia sp. AiPa1]|nr:LysR family transcriptional regulator substrate-binding protein [Frankia sp. AiPa1]
MAVTEAGARLLEHAVPLLLRLAAARTEVARAAGTPSQRLTIAAHPLAADRLAEVLARVTPTFPRLELRVVLGGTPMVATEVARGDVDLGIAVGLATSGDPLRLPDVGPIRAVGIAEEPPAVILPTGHPLAGRPGVRIADLVDAGWIDAPELGAGLDHLRGLTSERRLRARMRVDGADVQGLLALVAAGGGLALLPARIVHPGHDGQAGPSAHPDQGRAGRGDLVAVPVRGGVLATRGSGAHPARAAASTIRGTRAPGDAALNFRHELLSAGRPGPAAQAVAVALGAGPG